MYISITRYCSNSVIISLQRIRQREKFSSSQERTSQRHIEEQDLGGSKWEKEGRSKRVRRGRRRGGGGNTYTDTGISYTNKQKDDLGCCSRQTEHCLFSQLQKVINKQETLNPWMLSLCVAVCVFVCSMCGAVVASVCATCLFYFTKSPPVFGIRAVGNKPR